ncbi:MarR family transcriptional regulator [Candidatus Pacearchaeota archaeon]|nr:MarR family transcriptional regulator [Candidatus Pacearchaeota archaeon]
MENKHVGYLLLGISALIVIIIFLFNSALKEIVVSTCSMEKFLCPMSKTINQQTYLALGIVGLLIIVGLVLIFAKPSEKIIFKKIREQKKKIDTSELRSEEKKILSLVQENKAIFQSDIIEKTGFGKAKVTRIIDRLEGKGFVERKRRGMTNVVVMKE